MSLARPLWLAGGLVSVGLGAVGAALPILPTVPFLLLAAWFSARGSTRLHAWLYGHPRFGKLLIDWETQRAVSRRSKLIAVSMLAVSAVVMYHRLDNPWLLAGIGLLFAGVAVFLLTRPEPR